MYGINIIPRPNNGNIIKYGQIGLDLIKNSLRSQDQ